MSETKKYDSWKTMFENGPITPLPNLVAVVEQGMVVYSRPKVSR